MNDTDNFYRWPAVSYYVMGDIDDTSAPGFKKAFEVNPEQYLPIT
jgi:hypothetical protein